MHFCFLLLSSTLNTYKIHKYQWKDRWPPVIYKLQFWIVCTETNQRLIFCLLYVVLRFNLSIMYSMAVVSCWDLAWSYVWNKWLLVVYRCVWESDICFVIWYMYRDWVVGWCILSGTENYRLVKSWADIFWTHFLI